MTAKSQTSSLSDRWALCARERAPYVLLETSLSDVDNQRSLLFERPRQILTLENGDGTGAVFDAVERALSEGCWVAGYLSYELGYALEPRLAQLLRTRRGDAPLLWLGVFDPPAMAPSDAVITAGAHEGAAYVADGIAPNMSLAEYRLALEKIRRHIEAGDTYQVNYTLKHTFQLTDSPEVLYRSLRARQRVAYGACLFDGTRSVVSLSPELFFRRRGDVLETRPMKGTVRRGRSAEEDASLASWLANDAKNRAENVMIVDMIRNDLGRISPPGGVETTSLFDVEQYETLFQMTSTIRSNLSPGMAWHDVFAAMFPCASVTGAPKIRTMEIIAELESEPRGVYTGAIGFISPDNEACFNVAIRTIVVDEDGGAEMGIGSGVVYDSDVDSEYEECLLKGKFLTDARNDFALIETLLCHDGDVAMLRRHMNRLERSAAHFGFDCDTEEIRGAVEAIAQGQTSGLRKLRLVVERDGAFDITADAVAESAAGVRVAMSGERTSSADEFLRHKTTRRALYERGFREAVDAGFDEALFCNERGELTEGSFTNLFVEIDGMLFTPPLSAGLLPGVLREELIEAGKCEERTLLPADLEGADAVYIGNSVRGLMLTTGLSRPSNQAAP